MRTSHKAKDAAAEKQSYVCDTFTGHGKAHQPPLPGSPVRVFPMMPRRGGRGTVDPGAQQQRRSRRRPVTRARGHGPAAIPQQGTFADDRAWAESAGTCTGSAAVSVWSGPAAATPAGRAPQPRAG